MKDTIIKGTGNSRSIKSVPNLAALAPTYEAFLALLAGEGLPIDLGPLNAAGVQELGTGLSKANLLTDALCSALGLSTSATPTQAMDKLRTLIQTAQSTADGRANVASGSYVGTGQASTEYKVTLHFPFAPQLVVVFTDTNSDSNFYNGIFLRDVSIGIHIFANGGAIHPTGAIYPVTWNGNSVQWCSTNGYTSHPLAWFNAANQTYRYVAVG